MSASRCLRLGDLELEDSGGTIVVYRSRKKGAAGSTKSGRFRSVEIGPGLCAVLRDQVARRAELASGDRGAAFLFVMPVRVIKRAPGRWESAGIAQPLDRNTATDEYVHRVARWTYRMDAFATWQRCVQCRTESRKRPRP